MADAQTRTLALNEEPTADGRKMAHVGMYMVVLATEPTAGVTISIMSSD